MNIRFVASFAPIARDVAASRALYRDAIGVAFEGEAGDYLFTQKLDGVKHFGLWPLNEAATACFGNPQWPADVMLPQASIEFEVDDVPAAAAELEAAGYTLLHGSRTEPWGQTIVAVARPERTDRRSLRDTGTERRLTGTTRSPSVIGGTLARWLTHCPALAVFVGHRLMNFGAPPNDKETPMAWDFSTDPEFQKKLDWVEEFCREEVEPLEYVFPYAVRSQDPKIRALVKGLQDQVKDQGLWAIFLDEDLGGPGYGQLKLGLLNEILGRYPSAPQMFGAAAPDTGNMEMLAAYGTEEQKKRWLEPMLNQEMWSAYSMTEPQGGSDPNLFRTHADA